MNRKFSDLIDQTYIFPQTSFRVENDNLLFHDLPLKELVHKFGTPLKISYLPKIGEQIDKANTWFNNAINKCGYEEDYYFSYCTKSSHFAHVLTEALAHKSHIELSSAFDTDIILNLYQQAKLNPDTYILCNGYKTPDYFAGIQRMIHAGFTNVIPILDCMSELKVYETFDAEFVNIGLRMATEEEQSFDFYTSRFGIQKSGLIDFYKYRIHKHPKIRLKMLHFFVYTGIQDTTYYWNELHKHLKTYAEMKQLCPTLDALNIGGGLPIQSSLEFEYDYQYMCNEIVSLIKNYCNENGVKEPKLFTEFGTYTVGESSALIFKVLGTKRQNDRETWYIVDNSLICTLPDMWSKKNQFMMLPINKWGHEYKRAILGGLTCDNDDFYNFGEGTQELFLPNVNADDVEPLYVGFFHTGAYQEALSGFGGINHCLIPSPQHVLVDKDEQGELSYEVFAQEQTSNAVLKSLGYPVNN